MSAKRKRKKQSKKKASDAAARTGWPVSALGSDVDNGWGSDDAIFDFAGTSPDSAAEPVPSADSSGEKPRRAKRASITVSTGDSEHLTEAVQLLGRTDDRGEVFRVLMEFLAGSYERVALFAVKKNKICAWKHLGLDGGDDKAEIALEDSPLFHNLVQTQVPYHGTEIEPAAQEFLTQATGHAAKEIVVAPVAIGPRVVGVLYGDEPNGTLFDQQVAMVTRTAGLALQRILQASKS